MCVRAREKASRATVSITVANEAGETTDGETHDDLGMDKKRNRNAGAASDRLQLLMLSAASEAQYPARTIASRIMMSPGRTGHCPHLKDNRTATDALQDDWQATNRAKTAGTIKPSHGNRHKQLKEANRGSANDGTSAEGVCGNMRLSLVSPLRSREELLVPAVGPMEHVGSGPQLRVYSLPSLALSFVLSNG